MSLSMDTAEIGQMLTEAACPDPGSRIPDNGSLLSKDALWHLHVHRPSGPRAGDDNVAGDARELVGGELVESLRGGEEIDHLLDGDLRRRGGSSSVPMLM